MNRQSYFTWPHGCRAALTLSYDDGLEVHRTEVAEELEKNGLLASFNAPIQSDLLHHPHEWAAVARRGHELGNHTIFHPCRDEDGTKTWLDSAYNLCQYSPRRWQDEMRVANQVLASLDGKTERTFANTCCDNYLGVGEGLVCLETLMPGLFVAARGQFTHKPVNLEKLNVYNLGHTGADQRTFADLRTEIEALVATEGWLIYMIHGVGEKTHHLHIRSEHHRDLCRYLGDNRGKIWTAPMMDVVRQVKKT